MARLRHPVVLGLVCALGGAGAPAHAESLRCQGGMVAEGDSRLSVVHKCGPPQLADAFCAPVFHGTTLNLVPLAVAGAHVPCQPVELWLYERGSGHLVATLRIRSGRVQAIQYGHEPR